MDVGKKIKDVLKEKKISVAELSKIMKTPRTTIDSWIKKPSIDTLTLHLIAEAIKVPINIFFDKEIIEHPIVSIKIHDFYNLRSEILLNAVRGKALVYVQWDLTKEKFITKYKELKEPLSIIALEEYEKE